jgi:hypothetical protein
VKYTNTGLKIKINPFFLALVALIEISTMTMIFDTLENIATKEYLTTILKNIMAVLSTTNVSVG